LQNKFVLYCKSKNLNKICHKGKVRVAGLLSMTQKPPTAKGFCFLTLEDEFGIFNIVVPPKVYDQYRNTIYAHSLLEVQGHLENISNVINIKAEKVLPLIRKALQNNQLPAPGHTSINR
ncbi:MAG: OB-fold nucleic acid binding domain-containing protein, partial [Pseudobdellovibrionaceae bacterium]